MNALRTALPLAIAYLRERTMATLLNIALLALGVGTIIALILTLNQAGQRMERDAAGIDLVVGAKGSPLQLILSAVFNVDIPTGNIPLADAMMISAEPMVKRSIPLSLGDSFRSFRIVGTNPSYLELYDAQIAQGRVWNKALEAVVGAEVARATGLTVGSKFAGAHGLGDGGGDHGDQPFTVVGVLKPGGSVVDRLIVTSLDSVWLVHEHEISAAGASTAKAADAHKHDENREITALLIQYASPMAAVAFPRRINAVSGLQAASPALETARLFTLVGFGISALKLFAGIMMVCAALGIFIGLMNALNDRRADLALLRVLGADRATVLLTVLIQGFALGIAGVILGTLLGHAATEWMGSLVGKIHRVPLTGWTWAREELWVIASALALTLLASLFPAWRAYRDAMPELLSRT
ncbi:MAG: ABC transporter permease [Betaproteobacteria bacterium]|nr:ABC transporter permease [Betaproteobacteria bacterium]